MGTRKFGQVGRQELAAEAEAEAEFEIAELFDDIGAANDFDPRDAR